MRYLFGTGIIGAITAGTSLLRGTREQQWTWRSALAWLSWGITLALAIGAMVDERRARRGEPVPPDSSLAQEQAQRARKAFKSR